MIFLVEKKWNDWIHTNIWSIFRYLNQIRRVLQPFEQQNVIEKSEYRNFAWWLKEKFRQFDIPIALNRNSMESSQKFRTNFSEWFGYWALELLENQFARVNPVLIYENPCEIPWKLLTTIKSERNVFMMFVLRIVIIIAKVKSSITTCFDTPCISLGTIRFKSRSNRVYLFVTHNGNRKRNPFAKWKAVNFLSTFSQTGRFTRYT